VACELELANETNFPHKGVIDFVNNQVDPATGTLRIRGVFPNPGPDRVLQPGYFARVRVPGSEKHQAIMIPDLAVGTDQSQKYVLTVDDKNMVQYKLVKLGPVIDGMRVVREGLTMNDWVIINGLMSARPGTPVTPTRQTAETAATKPVAEATN
jgi:RND family efflux transporter MFP subunit